jgi:hypothetical protein
MKLVYLLRYLNKILEFEVEQSNFGTERFQQGAGKFYNPDRY